MKRTSGAEAGSETIGRAVENVRGEKGLWWTGKEGSPCSGSSRVSIAKAVGTLPALDDRSNPGMSSCLVVTTGESERTPSSRGGIGEETGRRAHSRTGSPVCRRLDPAEQRLDGIYVGRGGRRPRGVLVVVGHDSRWESRPGAAGRRGRMVRRNRSQCAIASPRCSAQRGQYLRIPARAQLSPNQGVKVA